jgi:hypothetical protein
VPDPTGAATARLTIRFVSAVDTPIPYRILWYHPGSIRTTAECQLREWRLPTLPVETPPDWKGAPPPPLTDVRLFALDEGEIFVDIDGWLDALAGGGLDDTLLGGFGVGRSGAREYGFAVGHNREGRSRFGVFDFTADAVVFPLPKELRAANRTVRRRLEQLASPPVPR